MGGRFVGRRIQRCDFIGSKSLEAGMKLAHTRHQAEQETESACQSVLWKGEPLDASPSLRWAICLESVPS
jgi:hypothetical protein